jgi:hypothetical protein
MSITASNVGQNNGIVMPEEIETVKDLIYGWPDTRTGLLDPGASPPSAPLITGVVDNADQDSVTVSVVTTPITNTVQLYYRQKTLSAWTTGETRTGSGDIVQTGLTAGIFYEIYCTAKNPNESAPSNLVTIFLASVPGTGTLEQSLYIILTGDSTLEGLVAGRITPGGDPVKGPTSVVYYGISMDADKHSMDGPDTLATRRFQINSYGLSGLQAVGVANAVRKALDGFSGTVDGVAISYVSLRDEGDLDDYEPGNKTISRHGVRQDYEITYTRN